MWLTQFEIKYEEFHLEFVEIVYYKLLVQNLASNMQSWSFTFKIYNILNYIFRTNSLNFGVINGSLFRLSQGGGGGSFEGALD